MKFIKTPYPRHPRLDRGSEMADQVGHSEALRVIAQADAVLIGAGTGLSTAAGIHYDGPDFEKAFADMIARYGFTDLYTSSFYQFKSEKEKWAYWSRHIDYARFAPEGKPLYRHLLKLVQGKEHFVITTNVDGQFIKAGFNPDVTLIRINKDDCDSQAPGIRHFICLESI